MEMMLRVGDDEDQSDQSDSRAIKDKFREGLVHERMGTMTMTMGLESVELKRKIREIKKTEVGIFNNTDYNRVDQSDQSGFGQVQSLI